MNSSLRLLDSKAFHILGFLGIMQFLHLSFLAAIIWMNDMWIVAAVILAVMNLVAFVVSGVVILGPFALYLAKHHGPGSAVTVPAYCLFGMGLLGAIGGILKWSANENSLVVSSGLGFATGVIMAIMLARRTGQNGPPSRSESTS